MLEIEIPRTEIWDNENEMFSYVDSCKLVLEHSLISISKWESKWNKPFLTRDEKTPEEMIDYVKCMIIDKFLSYSFIIYVLHFYMIKIMKVGIAKLFYGNDIVSMLSFLFLPLICVLLIILLAKVMERIVPVFYKISTGGR